MEQKYRESLWGQFGASIEMLRNAIELCPETHWDTETKFWYNAYHCIFFLDYYLTPDPVNFKPPAPFTLSEFADCMPERTYTKSEILGYLNFCRLKCKKRIAGLTTEVANSRWTNASQTMSYSTFEIMLYNMRHVQHHAAQLNLLLRQGIDDAPDWVFAAGEGLEKE